MHTPTLTAFYSLPCEHIRACLSSGYNPSVQELCSEKEPYALIRTLPVGVLMARLFFHVLFYAVLDRNICTEQAATLSSSSDPRDGSAALRAVASPRHDYSGGFDIVLGESAAFKIIITLKPEEPWQ